MKTCKLQKMLSGLVAGCLLAMSCSILASAEATNHIVTASDEIGYDPASPFYQLYFVTDLDYADMELPTTTDVPVEGEDLSGGVTNAQAGYRYGEGAVMDGMTAVEESLNDKILIELPADVLGDEQEAGFVSVREINTYFALPENGGDTGITINLLCQYTGKLMLEIAYKPTVFGSKFNAATTDLIVKFDEGFTLPNDKSLETVTFNRKAGEGVSSVSVVMDGPYVDPDYDTREKTSVISVGAPYNWNGHFITDITFDSQIKSDNLPGGTQCPSIQAPERIPVSENMLSEATVYSTREYVYINGVKLKDILEAEGNTDFTVQLNVTVSFLGTTNYNVVIAPVAIGIDEAPEEIGEAILDNEVTIEFKEGLVDYMGYAVEPMTATYDPETKEWTTTGVKDDTEEEPTPDPDPDPDPDPEVEPEPDDNTDPTTDSESQNSGESNTKTGVSFPLGILLLSAASGGTLYFTRKIKK